jgi:hypothetical protein
MNRTQRFIFCFALLFAFAIPASTAPVPGTEDWQPINPADLALKDNPASPGANAMILYRENFVNEKYVAADGEYVTEYFRIKIFTQEGVRFANIEIPFDRNVSDIKDIRARTIHPDGTIVNFEGKPFEKTVVRRSGDKYLVKSITLPDVQPGCIIEYRYRQQFRPRILWGEEWVVTRDLYTREGHFSILPYESSFQNFPLYFRQYGLSQTVNPTHGLDGVYSLVVRDIPAVEDEPYMPPVHTLEGRVEFYHTENGSLSNQTPDQYWHDVSKKWNDEIEHFLGKKNALEPEVAKTVGPNDTPEVKLKKPYARAQQVRNLDHEDAKAQSEQKAEDIKKNSNVEDVLKHGYGNGLDINAFFVGLVRSAGFEANMVYVAPRNSQVFTRELEDKRELSANMVWARAGGKEYFLDPAAPGYPFNLLPWFETNVQGIRVSNKPGDVISVPLPDSSGATLERHAELAVNESGEATGILSVDFTGIEAAQRREDGINDDQTGRQKALEDEIKSWLPAGSNFELTKLDNWDKNDFPLHVEGKITLTAFGSVAGHRILVPATIFAYLPAKGFQSAKRVNPVYFHYASQENDDTKFSAPAGYKVETVPKPVATNPASIVVYKITPSMNGGAAEVQRSLSINGIVIDKQYYAALRSFFSSVKALDDSQIVLQNAESAQK